MFVFHVKLPVEFTELNGNHCVLSLFSVLLGYFSSPFFFLVTFLVYNNRSVSELEKMS